MCQFDRAWIGRCKEENLQGAEYCAEHIEKKCSVCGEQATHDCGETNQFVCGTLLCGKLECKLQHFYTHHAYAFVSIKAMEEHLNQTPYAIVIAKVDYGKGEIEDMLNKIYGDIFKVLLLTVENDKQVHLRDASTRTLFRNIEEVFEYFDTSWHREIFEEKDIYSSAEPLYISETYSPAIVEKLTKIEYNALVKERGKST